MDANVARLIRFEGFYAQFEEFLPFSYSCRHAYDMTEDLYQKYFGERKYSSYECFRVVKSKNNARKGVQK